METYFLWRILRNTRATSLSVFATLANIQRINEGTREMIEGMLEDLKAPDLRFSAWTIDHFITNYLADDPDGDWG